MAYISNTWNYGAYKKKVDWPDTLGKRERHREFASENLDDVISYCGGLRGFADSIEKKARAMDKKRREGKAWESGTVTKEVAEVVSMIERLKASAAALEGSNAA